MAQYWLDLFTPETWEEAKENNFKLSGFREKRWSLVQKIEPGDLLVCYITRESRFSGILKVVSKPYFSIEASKKVWESGPFPCVMDVEPVIALDILHSIPTDQVISKLTIAAKWGGIIRGSPNRLNGKDGDTIKDLLKKSQKDKEEYPLIKRMIKKNERDIKPKVEDNLEENDVLIEDVPKVYEGEEFIRNVDNYNNSFNTNKNMAIKFDAEDKSLSDVLLGEEKYRIPRYQRPYSWSIDEVTDLWNDLRDRESVFLGSFVFNYERYEQDGFVEVIDGQQRLITLTILMAVLRDAYKELGEVKRANKTQDIIAHVDNVTLKEDYRLKCSDTLNKFFSDNIQKGNAIVSVAAKTQEEKRVKANYKFLLDEINRELEKYQEKGKKIQFLDGVKKQIFDFKIIWIKIENDDDAYSIFETVNARGADLTVADLLKNYIFSKLPKEPGGIDSAKEKWSTIEGNVESAKGILTVSKFIRYYWISKYKSVPEKRLYKEVKREINSPSDFLSDVVSTSEYYYKIASDSVNLGDWLDVFEDRKVAQKITESLVGLRAIGITQCYPLLFCLLMNKDKINFDFSTILKIIEKYHFAYSAICKLSGNVVEKIYSRTANEIQKALQDDNVKRRDKNIHRVLDLFVGELKEKYPPKDFFMKKFDEVEYKNYPLVIYILSNIARAKEKVEEKTYTFAKSNIEHILPQDPKEWGGGLNRDGVKNYVNKLGNLTLISKEINGRMGNKPLKEKVQVFKDTKLDINRELLERFKQLKYRWTEKDINERQKELAEFAYDFVWKF